MKNPVKYKMKELVGWSLDQLQAHEQVPIIVECDDGEVETIIEEIILSWILLGNAQAISRYTLYDIPPFCWSHHHAQNPLGYIGQDTKRLFHGLQTSRV